MSLPYFPMYPTDFEAKTSHLSIAEDGAYNRLLRICWMTPGCTMPADEAWIMRRARAVTEADQEAVRAILAEFFTIENGRYSNARLTREWNAANEAHERRKNAGAKGGAAKGAKTKEKVSSKATAMPKQPEPEPEYRDTIVSLGRASASSRKASKRALPENWVPDMAKAQSLMAELDLTRDEMNYCYQQMKGHAHATDRRLANWDQGFAMWVRKAVRDGDVGPGSRSRRKASGGSAFDF
jgi:uncharacterized protein YdaU (DUF1376 family)